MSIKFSFTILLTLLCIIIVQCLRKHPSQTYASRFRSIECQADNYTTVVNFCYIKAVSRDVTTLNLFLKNLKPSYKPIYIQMIVFYRYGNIYREVINTKMIEWCSIMEGMKSHLLLMQTIRQIQASAADSIHKCPYDTDMEVRNLTLDDTKRFDIFPDGIYKLSWLCLNKTFDVMWRLNVSIQVKSPLKESMG